MHGMAAASAGAVPVQQQQQQQQLHGPGGGGGGGGGGVGLSCGPTSIPLGQQPHHGARQFLGKVAGQSGSGLIATVQQHHNNPTSHQQQQQQLHHNSHHQLNGVQPNLVSGWKRAISNGDVVYLR